MRLNSPQAGAQRGVSISPRSSRIRGTKKKPTPFGTLAQLGVVICGSIALLCCTTDIRTLAHGHMEFGNRIASRVPARHPPEQFHIVAGNDPLPL